MLEQCKLLFCPSKDTFPDLVSLGMHMKRDERQLLDRDRTRVAWDLEVLPGKTDKLAIVLTVLGGQSTTDHTILGFVHHMMLHAVHADVIKDVSTDDQSVGREDRPKLVEGDYTLGDHLVGFVLRPVLLDEGQSDIDLGNTAGIRAGQRELSRSGEVVSRPKEVVWLELGAWSEALTWAKLHGFQLTVTTSPARVIPSASR